MSRRPNDVRHCLRLFKKFAGIDSIDIEVNETDPKKFIEIVAPLEPSFGGINLEDIKAPDCFDIEETLRERMNIPVFHDDQHGTAIIVAAAVMNAMHLVKKDIGQVKICTSGAGAAAIACMNMPPQCSIGGRLEAGGAVVPVDDECGLHHSGASIGGQREDFGRSHEPDTL